MTNTNITTEHKRAFEALRSGQHDNFALFSCVVDDQPAAAIVAVTVHPPDPEGEEPEYGITRSLSPSRRPCGSPTMTAGRREP